MDDDDLETWLIDIGHLVITKKSQAGVDALTDAERAVYDFWVIDYAVRNAGTLDAVEDLRPSAREDLLTFAQMRKLPFLSSWLREETDDDAFCDGYDEAFPRACAELKHEYERG